MAVLGFQSKILKVMQFEKKKEKDGVPLYVAPCVERVEVAVERGFAASGAANENWNEIPGGGSF
jgi:hypothetical protein